MKQAQVTGMTSTMAQLERDVQPGRWPEGVPDEEARFCVMRVVCKDEVVVTR